MGFLGQILLSKKEDEQQEYNFVNDLKEQGIGLGNAVLDSIKSLGDIATFKISTLKMKKSGKILMKMLEK